MTYELPAFSFAIATMNPVELGQGTFPLSEAATDRFAVMINIGYLPPEEEEKLAKLDFKRVRLNALMSKDRIIELRGAINEHVFLHDRSASTSAARPATRPYNPDTDSMIHSPSDLVSAASTLGRRPAPSSAGPASCKSGRSSSVTGPRCIRKIFRIWRLSSWGIGSGSGRTRRAMG